MVNMSYEAPMVNKSFLSICYLSFLIQDIVYGAEVASRDLSDLMESGGGLYHFVFTNFPSRQMNSFGSKLLYAVGSAHFAPFPHRIGSGFSSFAGKFLFLF